MQIFNVISPIELLLHVIDIDYFILKKIKYIIISLLNKDLKFPSQTAKYFPFEYYK